ncbi:MAG TPA: hypothetical protein VML92_07520 [Steroidobacteraceae bacterium]|nr:hypothetical protein [Steroidobacteraceae bacterium]
MKRRAAAGTLASLGRIGRHHAPGLAARKLDLLRRLARSRLPSARLVLRLHELLCFLDAYPDDRQVHRQVRRMLRHFGRRPDLQTHRQALAGTGIAGTDTPFRFYFPTAHWITRHWPGALALDRNDPDAVRELLAALPSLLDPLRAEWLAGLHPTDLAPLDQLAPARMTDADFVIGLIADMPGDEFSREAFGDRLDLSYVLRARRDTPERTNARFGTEATQFQQSPLRTGYADLRVEARRKPQRVRALRRRDALAAIRLARISMITRERDLAAFQFANPGDAFLVEDGRGLAFAMMGVLPARRATLTTAYTALTLKNGVPIGYIQADVLGRHGALSFNTFETFRGAEAAHVFARFIAIAYHLFGCTDFSVEPYQLGLGNEEGIESGAWWFYHRFGFRPRAPAARRLAARESSRRSASSGYRSSPNTLRRLARSHLFYSLDRMQQSRLPRTHHWLAAATRALRHFPRSGGDNRSAGAADAASKRLGLAKNRRLDRGVRSMLERWAGLVLALTARGRWSRSERRNLLRLIESKAGPNERKFHRRVLRHHRLRRLLDC